MGRGSSGPWVKYGCLGIAGLGAIALVVMGTAAGIAVRQNRAANFEHQAIVPELADSAVTLDGLPGPVRLSLEIHTAGVSVRPVAAGESIGIEADFDPRLFELSQDSEAVGGVNVMTVALRPLGSDLMALLRVKLGGRPAMLRIALPRDIPLELEGHLVRSFAAMELGGLSLASTKLNVKEGGVRVSFVEPLAAPMDSFSIVGNRGSLGVVGLGNASPREARLFQHVGAVDLDLRGAWSRDAKVGVVGGVAGGSLWLPENVRIRGIDDRRGLRIEEESEQPLPVLYLSISETMGRFVVLD